MSVEFKTPWWLPDGHSQTIWSAKVALPTTETVNWARSTWSTPDGDVIQVDSRFFDQTAPIVVLFHGLEGGSQSHYAQAFAQVCHEQGWNIVLPHFRGCGGPMNLAPRAYHSGDFQEIDWMLKRVQALHPGRTLMGVGVSLGGNALMKWVAETGKTAQDTIAAAVAVSSPLDLVAAGKAIDQGVNKWLYARMFLSTMREKAQRKWDQYPGLFDLKKAMSATTLEAFDDAFTAPLHGFKGVSDYWKKASAKPVIKQVRIPTLLMNAVNDPFVPARSLPMQEEVGSMTTVWRPHNGGHVGFVEPIGPQDWRGHVLAMPRAVCAWLAQRGLNG